MSSSRYILHKKVAKGGMAEIYLGKQVGEDGFQRICCIKRILPHYAGEEEFVKMFRDEAHIGKSLQHANIARIEGFEEVEGSYAMVMEFVNGADLRTILSAYEKLKRRMEVPNAVFAIAEAARGLHYAHTLVDAVSGKHLGIVHRDVSPQNILISFEGEVKITDFGIADADSKATETKPGTVKGKYSYMSPEQIMAKAVDARSDVFALAIVLWECLSMRRLFHAENEVATIQKVRECDIERDIDTLDGVDDGLRELVRKGLQKDVNKRFQSAQEFENALRHYLSRAYPEFTVDHLSDSLKRLLFQKRSDNLQFIKELLSKVSEPSAEDGPSGAQAAADSSRAEEDSSRVVSSSAREGTVAGTQAKLKTPQSSWDGTRPRARSGQMVRQKPAAKPSSAARMPVKGRRRGQAQSSGGFRRFLAATVVAALALGVGYLSLQKFASREPLELQLKTLPSRVKLRLDGIPLFEGRYVETPILISGFGAGKHRLAVERRGFSTETIDFIAEKHGKIVKNNVVSDARSRMAPTACLIARPDMNVSIDLDNRTATSMLSTKKV